MSERYQCECCDYWTLTSRGMYEICPVCLWEDDPAVEPDGLDAYGGPNGMSLSQGRQNFARLGATSEKRRERAREPLPEERHPPG